MARCHGLVVKADDSQSKGCGFKPRPHILDGKQAKLAIYCITKNKEIKVAKWGTPKNKYKKPLIIHNQYFNYIKSLQLGSLRKR